MHRLEFALALLALGLAAPARADVQLDSTFGGSGVTGELIAGTSKFASVTATAIQPDGKLLVAGRAFGGDPSTSQRVAVVRLDGAGVLDPTFGSGGRVFL